MNIESKDISEYYDHYTAHQQKLGINVRHRSILKDLKKAGLKRSSSVLEIGCGIGTLTHLIGSYCSKGKVVAVDISPKSVEIARANNKKLNNIEFMVSDMSDFSHRDKFDFVVLPDVLEHIPVENHKALFSTIRQCIHSDSKVLINIPAPRFLQWAHKNRPDLLQIIDQPIATNELLNAVYPNGFYLHSLKTYALAYEEGDYQSIVLQPEHEIEQITKKSKFQLVLQEIKSRLFY